MGEGIFRSIILTILYVWQQHKLKKFTQIICFVKGYN